jgi:hypothetical protein
MHTCIHTYIHTCMHTYIHTYIHTYTHACMHTYIQKYIHTYIHTYVCYIHTYINICVCVRVFLSLSVRRLQTVGASVSVHRQDTEGRAPQQDTEGGGGGWGGESSWSSDWSSKGEGVGSAMRAVDCAITAESWCVIQNYIMIYQLKFIELFVLVTYKKKNCKQEYTCYLRHGQRKLVCD